MFSLWKCFRLHSENVNVNVSVIVELEISLPKS